MKAKGNRPKLTRRAVAHARWCAGMRGKVSQGAVAGRLGVDPRTLRRYILGNEVPLEDWLEGARGSL